MYARCQEVRLTCCPARTWFYEVNQRSHIAHHRSEDRTFHRSFRAEKPSVHFRTFVSPPNPFHWSTENSQLRRHQSSPYIHTCTGMRFIPWLLSHGCMQNGGCIDRDPRDPRPRRNQGNSRNLPERLLDAWSWRRGSEPALWVDRILGPLVGVFDFGTFPPPVSRRQQKNYHSHGALGSFRVLEIPCRVYVFERPRAKALEGSHRSKYFQFCGS